MFKIPVAEAYAEEFRFEAFAPRRVAACAARQASDDHADGFGNGILGHEDGLQLAVIL